jgi:hypothetical protein
MNEELKTKLLEIITAAQKAGADAYDYALKEAPELAREIVLWNVIDRVGQLVVGVAALVLAAWLWRKIASNWDKWGSFDDEKMLFPVALVIAVVVAVIFTASGGIGIAQATLAPRVFFIMSCKELLTR